MDWATLDINVVSAEGINITSKKKLYVVVSIFDYGQREQTAKTNIDREGGGNPSWNFPIKFDINISAAKQDNNSYIRFTLKRKTISGDKYAGEVKVLFHLIYSFKLVRIILN